MVNVINDEYIIYIYIICIVFVINESVSYTSRRVNRRFVELTNRRKTNYNVHATVLGHDTTECVNLLGASELYIHKNIYNYIFFTNVYHHRYVLFSERDI